MNDRPHYPWKEGDALFAAELNAAIMNMATGAMVGETPNATVVEPLWWDSVSGQLFIRYDDGSSVQWVSANSIDASTLEGSFLPLTGGAMTGPFTAPITVGTGTGTPTLTLNGAAGSGQGIVFQEVGTPRFRLITASDRTLNLYGFDTSGGYVGNALNVNAGTKEVWSEFTLRTNTSAALASGAVTGLQIGAHNTGTNPTYGAQIQYQSVAGGAGFDTGLGVVASFNPTFQAGVSPAHQALYLIAESPNDTTHSWGGNIGEMNYVNRGADVGFKRDRTLAGNNTGGLLFVAESFVLSGGPGEGKNVGYGFAVSRSGTANSTGFPAKMYIGFNAEPNSIAGLTGRAYYATGDITGVASQYPYGPFQVEGTWLHGFDHTLATYMDNQATILLNGQNIAWIGGGTTASPTGTATIGTFGSGTSTGLLLRPATSGYIATSTPLVVGGGTTAQSVTVNGASGADNGFVWQTAGNTRWKLSLNGSDDINLYAFNSSGGFVGTIFAANSTALYVQVDLNAARVGFNGTGAITKPTGYGTPTGTATRATFATGSVTLPVLAEHVKALIDDLTAYGLIAP